MYEEAANDTTPTPKKTPFTLLKTQVKQTSTARADIAPIKITAREISVHYGDKQALFGVDLDIRDKSVTALIGPSGCGKTTFLRCINRMNDTIHGAHVSGRMEIGGIDIYQQGV